MHLFPIPCAAKRCAATAIFQSCGGAARAALIFHFIFIGRREGKLGDFVKANVRKAGNIVAGVLLYVGELKENQG